MAIDRYGVTLRLREWRDLTECQLKAHFAVTKGERDDPSAETLEVKVEGVKDMTAEKLRSLCEPHGEVRFVKEGSPGYVTPHVQSDTVCRSDIVQQHLLSGIF